jgi:hypothetical protein
MLVDGTLVLVSALVNGITITQDSGDVPALIDYYQIELETHDCVIAEGTWSETYADGPGLRAQFQNAAEFYELYPEQPPPEELKLCASRPERGATLEAALRPVVARAAALCEPGRFEGYIDGVTEWKIEGWARYLDYPGLPVLEVFVAAQQIGAVLACDGRDDLDAAGIGNRVYF